jgi:ectoine hydroxylase-related dioxygenase (phytanoyl-CoA dioxygenase family)
MKIGEWKEPPELSASYLRIRDLGLLDHLAELDTFGFTIIPPERAAPAGLVRRLRERILEISAERNRGIAPDLATGATNSDMVSPAGQHLFFLLGEDPAFQEALLNPVGLAFARYLLPDAVISSVTSMIKGPGRLPLRLHSDQSIHPSPRSLVCNVSYLLSDYDRDNGALCFVPGSQVAMRQPTDHENFRYEGMTTAEVMARVRRGERIPDQVAIHDAPGIVPIEAPMGSLVVWHGNTWHGAYNRRAPGLRINLILYFCSMWLRPQEAYRELLPQEILDRHGDEFARLVGREVMYGWGSEGPEWEPGVAFERHRRRPNAGVTMPALAR